MIGANKILTVSYGTFSCTLEGFDEPFTTMKAIAEYFRELAAEDRYFGAEPPTPDAEMLHRIAEREIQRRVEAKISENAVVLRQTDAPSVAQPEPVEPAAVAQPEPAPARPVAAEAPVPQDASIGDKLRRIRAVVSNAQAVAATPVAEAAYYEDIAEADSAETTAYAEPMDEDFGFHLELGDNDLTDVLNLNAPDTLTAAEAAPDAEAEVTAVAIEVEEPAEIDAVAPAEVDAETAAVEAVAVEAGQPAEVDAMAEDTGRDTLLDDLQSALVADADQVADAVDPDWTDTDEETLRAALDDTADMPSDEDEVAHVVAADSADAAVWEAVEAATVAQDLPAVDAAEASVMDEAETDAAAPVIDSETTAIDGWDDEFEAENDDEDGSRSPLANLIAQTRARVLNVRGTDRRAPEPKDMDAEDQPTAAQDDDETADDAGILAGIEAAIDAIDARDEATDQEEPGRVPAAGRARLAEDAEDGGDFDRLMEEANTKLEGAESRRRFSAISHLKAAVAATVADRILKPKDAPSEQAAEEADEMDRYRDDLSRAVRPRRPEGEPDRVTARPAMPMRPAPLVLVSEQRVDRETGTDPAVRPRRVAASTYALGEDDDVTDGDPLSPEEAKSFLEFADRLGARSLAELLEAAAVYTATVEGKESFSRPHLLRRVNAASGSEDYSREDCLRSFGSLLRQGKIQKVERGRFSVTDASSFMSEMRRAAN